jgi:hypothetical protein
VVLGPGFPAVWFWKSCLHNVARVDWTEEHCWRLNQLIVGVNQAEGTPRQINRLRSKASLAAIFIENKNVIGTVLVYDRNASL